MKFILNIALCCIALLAVSGAAHAGGRPIYIGALLPLTGMLSKVGLTHVRGHEFAVQEINEHGGIRSMGGAKLQMLYEDTAGDPIQGMHATNKLINQGVIALIGAYQSAVVLPTSEIAERRHVPYVISTALSDKLTARGFKYVFRPEATISDFVRDEFKFMSDTFGATLPDKRMALLHEDSLFGQFTAILQRSLARQSGLTIVADVSYSCRSDHLDDVMKVLKKASPDIVLQTSYIQDAIKIGLWMHKHQMQPQAIIATGAGPKDPAFIKALGSKANYWFVVNEWNHDMRRDGAEELNKRFYHKYGENMDGIAAMSYVSTWLLKEALEKAKSIEAEAVRMALSSTNIVAGPAAIVPMGKIAFNEYGQNKFVNLITQIIEGEHQTVWPPELAARKPVISSPQ